mgnify:CR=1 FL=1
MRFFQWLLDLLYPPKCCFCHKLSREALCPACRKEIPYTNAISREQSFPHVKCCLSPLYYKGHVRDSVLRYKFHGMTGYASVYGELMGKCIDESGISCDIISWVPLSRKRFRQRGYNQSELIARELSGCLGVPCMPLLKKIRHNPAQSGIRDAARRRANVAGVYRVREGDRPGGKRVLLVDDVVTTGASLSECARMLREAGCPAVYAATLARRKD